MTALFDTPLWQSIVAAQPAPDSDFWYQPVGTMTPAGVNVTPESAMRTSAVFACVRVIAETAGSLPLILYRRLERGKERASDHPIYNLLRYAPNPQQTALEFIEMMTAHCTLRGNAFALPVFRRGVLVELWPLHPDRMQVGVAELALPRRHHLAAEMPAHQLHAVADPQHRHAQLEQLLGHCRRPLLVNRLRPAGEDDPFRVESTDRRQFHVEGMQLAVDVRLAHPPGDELGVLRPEI